MPVDLFRLDWIGLTREEPVDPTRRIVDPHHHLWPDDERPHYLLPELLADTRAGHNVTDTVFVECQARYRQSGPEALRPVEETELVVREAKASDASATRVAAIVGFADLNLGDEVDAVLDAHEAAGDGRFRGIRHLLTWDVTRHAPGRPADEQFRRGVARLGAKGYSFDAWAFHPQLGDVADLAGAVEETTIVVNHLGGPLGIAPYTDRSETRVEWRRGMRLLASCPNVFLKLGGVGLDHYFGMGWVSRERPPGSDEVAAFWRDDVQWCIDTFGPARCMFESNYPADRQALGYTVIWNAFQKMAAGYSEDEQDRLFSGTAARVYRIADRPGLP